MEQKIKWMINDINGRYVGYVFYKGHHLYASGRSKNALSANIAQQMWRHGLPTVKLMLEDKPTEGMSFEHATEFFINRAIKPTDENYFRHKVKKPFLKKTRDAVPNMLEETNTEEVSDVEQTEKPKITDENCYFETTKDGELVVFKKVEVARFKLEA